MEERNSIIYKYSRQAEKFFQKHKDAESKFKENILKFILGEKVDIVLLKGNKDLFRIRIGKYRVVFMVINEQIAIINVLRAESRGDVYKRLGK